jgi:hypothetical protein
MSFIRFRPQEPKTQDERCQHEDIRHGMKAAKFGFARVGIGEGGH